MYFYVISWISCFLGTKYSSLAFRRLISTNFVWSILEYFDLDELNLDAKKFVFQKPMKLFLLSALRTPYIDSSADLCKYVSKMKVMLTPRKILALMDQ